MAQKHTVELVDDLDGKRAVETVAFALDGASYEIDLSKANATALRKALAPFTAAARQMKGKAAKNSARRAGPDPSAVREWAAANGIELPARGRIPNDVIEQFRAAS